MTLKTTYLLVQPPVKRFFQYNLVPRICKLFYFRKKFAFNMHIDITSHYTRWLSAQLHCLDSLANDWLWFQFIFIACFKMVPNKNVKDIWPTDCSSFLGLILLSYRNAANWNVRNIFDLTTYIWTFRSKNFDSFTSKGNALQAYSLDFRIFPVNLGHLIVLCALHCKKRTDRFDK